MTGRRDQKACRNDREASQGSSRCADYFHVVSGPRRCEECLKENERAWVLWRRIPPAFHALPLPPHVALSPHCSILTWHHPPT